MHTQKPYVRIAFDGRKIETGKSERKKKLNEKNNETFPLNPVRTFTERKFNVKKLFCMNKSVMVWLRIHIHMVFILSSTTQPMSVKVIQRQQQQQTGNTFNFDIF